MDAVIHVKPAWESLKLQNYLVLPFTTLKGTVPPFQNMCRIVYLRFPLTWSLDKVRALTFTRDTNAHRVLPWNGRREKGPATMMTLLQRAARFCESRACSSIKMEHFVIFCYYNMQCPWALSTRTNGIFPPQGTARFNSAWLHCAAFSTTARNLST